MLLADACGAEDLRAAERSLESLRFAGDAVISSVDAFCASLAAGATLRTD